MKRLVLFLLLFVVACTLTIPVLQRARPAHSASPPVTLVAIATWNNYGQAQYVFHRGDNVQAGLILYNNTGTLALVTNHTAIYHVRYRLYNAETEIGVPADGTSHPYATNVFIPLNAPLGIYKYYLTLKQSGYADQERSMTFKVVK